MKNSEVLKLKVDDRVKAKKEVWDIPEKKNILAAVEGEFGTVEHTEPGCCPTVRFDRTGHATTVGDSEVSAVQ